MKKAKKCANAKLYSHVSYDCTMLLEAFTPEKQVPPNEHAHIFLDKKKRRLLFSWVASLCAKKVLWNKFCPRLKSPIAGFICAIPCFLMADIENWRIFGLKDKFYKILGTKTDTKSDSSNTCKNCDFEQCKFEAVQKAYFHNERFKPNFIWFEIWCSSIFVP